MIEFNLCYNPTTLTTPYNTSEPELEK